jgi:hypothetical protein
VNELPLATLPAEELTAQLPLAVALEKLTLANQDPGAVTATTLLVQAIVGLMLSITITSV